MDILKIKPNVQKAVFLAKRAISELVYDAINLEGICFTLPEVQTLLEGITIGGHRLSDQNIALNQARAWKLIFERSSAGGPDSRIAWPFIETSSSELICPMTFEMSGGVGFSRIRIDSASIAMHATSLANSNADGSGFTAR